MLLRFAFKVYRRPFRVPVRTSRGVWMAREGVLVRVEREDGRSAVGEIAPLEAFGTETLAGAVAWCASMAGPCDAGRLRERFKGMPCCAWAVSTVLARLDAAEHKPPAGKPSALAVASLLPTGASANEALSRALDAGFTTFKIKIGAADFGAERVMIDRLAAALPAGARLRLDANGGLDLRTALRWCDAAAAWLVEFIEQPLPVSAEDDLVRMAHDEATPLALDESVRGADDIKRWRDRGWPGIFVIKPAIAGDPADWMPEVAMAPTQFVFSSALETNVGMRAALRQANAASLTRPVGFGVGAFFPDDGLGGGVSQPSIDVVEFAANDEDAVWNRL